VALLRHCDSLFLFRDLEVSGFVSGVAYACWYFAVVDRKISFAVLGAVERSDSLHSSTTSISQTEAAAADTKGH